MSRKIKVLVVDDSAVIRNMLSFLLASDPEIEVIGVAIDPFQAREKIVELNPDVITLDIEMPRMDGITFLEKLMKHRPLPTIIISSLSQAGSEMALQALQAGAVEVLAKPTVNVKEGLEQIKVPIVNAVKAAAVARLRTPSELAAQSFPVREKKTSISQTTHQILAMGSSTGGTEALKVVLSKMPADIPGTLIVQHIPPIFSKAFAEALNKICPFEVKEAEDGDRVIPGRVLVAPGNFHMELTRSGAYYYAHLHQQSPIHGVRPAVDFLFNSVASVAGRNALGVILTGMGKDGAKGMLAMKQAGAFTVAQDEKTCVVYGMPREAVDLGAVDKICPLDDIAQTIVEKLKKVSN